LLEISEIFRGVFGDDAINDRVRVIHAWWAAQPSSYEEQLRWVNAHYGPPSRYLYAVAAAGYFNIEGIRDDASVDDVLLRLEQSSASGARNARVALQGVADRYGLAHATYEGGPDTAGPLQWTRDTGLLLTVIAAHEDPRMHALVLYDLGNNWFAHPEIKADMFVYFTLQSAYSRWGMWGLTQDITDLRTPKYRAITELAGLTAAPPPAPLGFTAKYVDTRRVDLAWHPSFRAESYTVNRTVGGMTTVAAEGLTTTVFSDRTAPDGPVSYSVVAVNAQGAGSPSRTLQVAPVK
jgi:hypothetical protein